MFKDKQNFLNHIADSSQIEVLRKIIDKSELVLRNHSVESTDFLDPYQRRLAQSILNRIVGISYEFEGGYEDAERKSIVIYPEYLDYSMIENPVGVILIEGNFKFNRSSHSDYLGSLMGKGIKREKIGDILPFDDRAFIVMHSDIVDYVELNLDRIGRETIKIKRVDFDNIEIPDNDIVEKIITASSDRLDVLISEVYGLSRSKSSLLIDSGKVKVNFEPINNKSKKIDVESLISIRGYGRAKIKEYLGDSRKGKYRYKVEIYR